MRHHHRLTVATQRVLEQPCQLAVAVVYILTARPVTCSETGTAAMTTDSSTRTWEAWISGYGVGLWLADFLRLIYG